MVRTVTKICNLIISLILVMVLGIIAVLLVPKLFGYDSYAVLSGSMEPNYRVGSVVYVKKGVSPDTIQVGDPITFIKADHLVVTHRVAEVHKEKREFITKGDANEVVDLEPVSFEQLIGKAAFSIPWVGYISIYVKTKIGFMAASGIFLILILAYLIPEILKPESDKKERNKIHG